MGGYFPGFLDAFEWLLLAETIHRYLTPRVSDERPWVETATAGSMQSMPARPGPAG